ncbi:hypothetical protein EMCRGX_G026548 [Ephydatia muelleri]
MDPMQYSSQEMKEFALQYGFRHTTSSPHYPRGHGQAERAVKTVKSLLLDAEDPFLALLNYRATPFPWCGLSLAELLFGKQISTTLPQAGEVYELQDEQDGRLEHNDNDEQEEGTAKRPDPEEPAEKEVKDATCT